MPLSDAPRDLAPDAAKALLDTFGRLMIINLPSRADRRQGMETELRRIGLSLDHPAVHLFPAIRPSEAAGFPSIGAHGAYLSHLAVMERLLAEGWERLLVLEDDASFGADFATRWPAMARALAGRDWHLLYGHPGDRPTPPADAAGLVTLPADLPLIQLHLTGLTRHAAALAVPELRAMLARAPGSPEGGPMHVDGALNWVRRRHPGLIALAAAPALANQRPSRSDIAEPRWFDRVPGLTQLATLARKFR